MGAGYSGTPLLTKLGVDRAGRVAIVNDPGTVLELGDLPAGVDKVSLRAKGIDVIVWFVTARRDLERRIEAVAARLDPAGGLWVCWPKRASGVETDMTEDVVREVALPLGLVDNKVAAINATWSGLRLVVRKALRETWPPG